MNRPSDDAEGWRNRLAAEAPSWRWTVVDEIGSTQDLARDLPPGAAVTALRQRSGRGRLGRAWADTGSDGLAVTFTLPAERAADPWLAIASALAAARAIEAISALAVGIKWPNDLVYGGRKLGGILIERIDRVALVGIGINVSQPDFPGELEATATSLARIGRPASRLNLLVSLATGLAKAVDESAEVRAVEFARRDALRGGWIRATSAGETLEGTVRAVEPVVGLHVDTAEGERFLPAATASILDWRPA